jgi:hypothetical protein
MPALKATQRFQLVWLVAEREERGSSVNEYFPTIYQ